MNLKTLYPKITQLFHMNSNEDKLCIKIVVSNAMYNFVVKKFLN